MCVTSHGIYAAFCFVPVSLAKPQGAQASIDTRIGLCARQHLEDVRCENLLAKPSAVTRQPALPET